MGIERVREVVCGCRGRVYGWGESRGVWGSGGEGGWLVGVGRVLFGCGEWSFLCDFVFLVIFSYFGVKFRVLG